MQSFIGAVRSARRQCFATAKIPVTGGLRLNFPAPDCVGATSGSACSTLRQFRSSFHSMAAERNSTSQYLQVQHAPSLIHSSQRSMSTDVNPVSTDSEDASDPAVAISPRIKFKRLDKTARNIMQILDREAVANVKSQREVPDIKPGYIIQMKVESPENKRRVTTIKGIVIARRNAGLNTTFRLRRLVAGIGVESLFPLYSPNIKEVKVLDKKKVRRAKLYYLRDRMNPLKK